MNTSISFSNTLTCAQQLDQQDSLHSFRDKFYIPIVNGKECYYFTGNSLGLQPKTAQDYVLNELEDWANYGTEGYFHARNPWVDYHDLFPNLVADIVGALPEEVVVMNQLTVNLHLLMVSFYRPTQDRFKIICEAKAFPSDQYAFHSQVLFHGLNPADAIIEVGPREGTDYIEPSDILEAIKKHGNETALVLFGGVNYYNGQLFDLKAITKAAHEIGALCGFDLAHAAGNVHLELHEWDVDFACWCTYKYLNSGPAGVAGAFIHQRHIFNSQLPRFAGWWGHNRETRFKMGKEFDPIPTAEGWQLSNTSILSMAAHKASLDIFAEAGMHNLVKKGKHLSAYLIYILDQINQQFEEAVLKVITPINDNERGCQVSIQLKQHGRKIFDELKKEGVIADWREPDVIRVTPVPLYNRYEDVYQFGCILQKLIIQFSA